jgi:hypothetical protein
MKRFRRPGAQIQPDLLFGLILIAIGASCNLPVGAIPTVQSAVPTPALETSQAILLPTASPTSALAPELTHTPTEPSTETPTQLPTQPPTETATALPTHTPTESPTPTITPTYAILRGKVLQQSNCRYGPGAPYLYKYGLYPETVLEIIGRNELGTWVVIQAIGGSNPCWVKASLLEIRGEVMSLAPTSLPLPQSPYYDPPTGVSAVRQGNEVSVSWNAVILRPGDDSEQIPYVVEAWVCTGGKLIFTPVGAYTTLVTIQDERGCSEPSHARLAAAEKHGYTAWVEIPWP